MKTITISARFDGKQILLDEPYELEPNARLMVTVLPEEDTEHQEWLELGLQALAHAYDDDEVEYPDDALTSCNPDYEGR